MAKTLMTKPGQADILVNTGMVAFHQQLGWSVASGSLDVVSGLDVETVGNPTLASGILAGALVRHYQITPAAVSATAAHGAIALSAAAQTVTTNISNPDYPRTATIKGSVAGISADVFLIGTNILDEGISDIIALDGTTEVAGVVAFKTISEITVPAETHAPAAQVETATAAGTVTGAGNASVVVTAAGMAGSPKTILVAVAENDTANDWAVKVRAALNADAAVTAKFTVSGATNKIILTANIPAANDTSLNMALANVTSTGITTAASSANTTAGVAFDTVSIGLGKKFGLPHVVGNAALLTVKLFNGSADSGSLEVNATQVEKNLFSLNGTPDGEKVVDLYYFA